MTRAERDQWNREHRCCGACAHWHIWDDANPEMDLCKGDCDKIEAGTDYAISEDGKQIYTYDGYSFEDECYDEDLHCFEEVSTDVGVHSAR